MSEREQNLNFILVSSALLAGNHVTECLKSNMYPTIFYRQKKVMTNISNWGSLLFGTLAEKLQVSNRVFISWFTHLKALQEAGKKTFLKSKGLKWQVVEFAALLKERPVAMGRERGWPLLSPCAIFNFPPGLLNVDMCYILYCSSVFNSDVSGKTLCGSNEKASDINSFCSCGFDFWFSHLSCQPVPGVSEAHSGIGTGSSANVG